MRARTHCDTRVLASAWGAYLRRWLSLKWCSAGWASRCGGRWTSREHTLRMVRVVGCSVLYVDVLTRVERPSARERARRCNQLPKKAAARSTRGADGDGRECRVRLQARSVGERCTYYSNYRRTLYLTAQLTHTHCLPSLGHTLSVVVVALDLHTPPFFGTMNHPFSEAAYTP